LKDRNAVLYFLSRAAAKEPRNFIEREMKDKDAKNDEKIPLKPIFATKV
jgi:hypothetical protein